MTSVFLSKLGQRGKAQRIWVEECGNKSRLANNGFPPNQPIEVIPGSGGGVIIHARPQNHLWQLGRGKISKRGDQSLLSVENIRIGRYFSTSRVRIRVEPQRIFVYPSLCRLRLDVGRIPARILPEGIAIGNVIEYWGETIPLQGAVQNLEGILTLENLYFVASFIQRHQPNTLGIQGPQALRAILQQYLEAQA